MNTYPTDNRKCRANSSGILLQIGNFHLGSALLEAPVTEKNAGDD
jgi:hypothetical protein